MRSQPNIEETVLVSWESVGAADVCWKFLHLGSRLDGKQKSFESLWGFFVLVFLLIVFFIVVVSVLTMLLIGSFWSLSFVHLASFWWLSLSQLGGLRKKFANMQAGSAGSHGRIICRSISNSIFLPLPSWHDGRDKLSKSSGNIREMHSLTSPACCLTTSGFLLSLHFWLFGAILQMAAVQSDLLAITRQLSSSSQRASAGYFLQASWWWQLGLRLPGKQLGTGWSEPAGQILLGTLHHTAHGTLHRYPDCLDRTSCC